MDFIKEFSINERNWDLITFKNSNMDYREKEVRNLIFKRKRRSYNWLEVLKIIIIPYQELVINGKVNSY